MGWQARGEKVSDRARYGGIVIARILLGSVAFDLLAAQLDTPMICEDDIVCHLLRCSSFLLY